MRNIDISPIPTLFKLTQILTFSPMSCRSYDLAYPPSAANDQIAWEYGRQGWGLFIAGDVPGREFTAYVNYAAGDESLEARYGYEPWRLEKLRGLKAKYDPESKFMFYNPIS